MFVGRGLAPAVFALNTCTVGEHSICSRKGKGGYGIRPYDIVEIYLLFAGNPFASKCAIALRYEIAFSAKVAEANASCLFLVRKTGLERRTSGVLRIVRMGKLFPPLFRFLAALRAAFR